eukprot:COSAG01_NODE_3988_length_5458_cov_55.445792_2_plen_63_part_00
MLVPSPAVDECCVSGGASVPCSLCANVTARNDNRDSFSRETGAGIINEIYLTFVYFTLACGR